MCPPETLAFLGDSEANNYAGWFRANRARYDAHLVEPARALAQSLEHLGEPCLFRPYNDARFGPRPPIKEQLGMAIGDGAAGGYYVELSLDGLLVGAGLHHPATDQLERFRLRSTTNREQGPSIARSTARWRRACRSSTPSSSARRAATASTIRASSTCAAST